MHWASFRIPRKHSGQAGDTGSPNKGKEKKRRQRRKGNGHYLSPRGAKNWRVSRGDHTVVTTRKGISKKESVFCWCISLLFKPAKANRNWYCAQTIAEAENIYTSRIRYIFRAPFSNTPQFSTNQSAQTFRSCSFTWQGAANGRFPDF